MKSNTRPYRKKRSRRRRRLRRHHARPWAMRILYKVAELIEDILAEEYHVNVDVTPNVRTRGYDIRCEALDTDIVDRHIKPVINAAHRHYIRDMLRVAGSINRRYRRRRKPPR